MASNSGDGGKRRDAFSMLMSGSKQASKDPKVFPVLKRPSIVQHSAMKEIMGNDEMFESRFPPKESNDANTDRLMGAIYQAREAFQAIDPDSNDKADHAKRAGHVNEARHFDSVLRKYQSLAPEEQAKRHYYPQTTIYPNGSPGNARRPDLLKIKDPGDGTEPRASFTEFKTHEFDKAQRTTTLAILSNPAKVRGTHNPGFSGMESTTFDFAQMPITKYKTVFTDIASHPEDPGKHQLTPTNTGKGVITGTNVNVFSKRSR